MGLQKHKTFSILCPRMKQFAPSVHGNEINDPCKRRKLFNVSTKTSACKNLLNLDSCLSNNVCRNFVDKNSNLLDLLKKVDSVRQRFN